MRELHWLDDRARKRRTLAQPADYDLAKRKAVLEAKKLELEVAHLEDNLKRPGWPTSLVAFVAGLLGGAVSVYVARRERLGAFEHSVHKMRLERYGDLVSTCAGLAVYFPHDDSPMQRSLTVDDCAKMGGAMSKWYFEGGGLLMSEATRVAYFDLIRGLTRASEASELRVPQFPDHAEDVSIEKLDHYREELTEADLRKLEEWTFGVVVADVAPPAQRFRDYVLLQRLSSQLRKALTEDLRSRRRPS